jgi:hypothetical protein
MTNINNIRIEDHRINSSWVPVKSILEEFLPKFDQTYFIGIRKLIFLDKDYVKDKTEAGARYRLIKGTKSANIEFYLEYLNELPDEGKQSHMYLSYILLKSLFHELYHHRVRGQRLVRQPKSKIEEKNADNWAIRTINPVFVNRYQGKEYEDEWDSIQDKIRESMIKKKI